MLPVRLQLVPASRGGGALRQSQRPVSVPFAKRFASTANTNPPSPTKTTTAATPSPPPSSPIVCDERTILSRLAPFQRVACLCPVPLGRGRVSWSGGDPSHPDDATVNLDFGSHPRDTARYVERARPLHRAAKSRFGHRYAIGVAVSDPYLTRAKPVRVAGEDRGVQRRFVAEVVPTFRCDAHNLGSSPIFHTNLPYFRDDFLQHIGHFDIGAIVLALPMALSRNPYYPTLTETSHPTRSASSSVQLKQETKLDQVREHLLGVLQNYVSHDDDEQGDSMSEDDGEIRSDGAEQAAPKQRRGPLGPLDLQGRIDHRLAVTDVLSRANGGRGGNWDYLSERLRRIEDRRMMGMAGGSTGNYFPGGDEHQAWDVFSSVPPELHAAVALNAMLEKYTCGSQDSLF